MILCIDTSYRPYYLVGFYQGVAKATLVECDQGNGENALYAGVKSIVGKDKAIEAVVVANGPGSFTSLRHGIGFAVGFAMAHSLPLYAVSSLRLYAACADIDTLNITVVAYATRHEVYVQTFTPKLFSPIDDANVCRIEKLDLNAGSVIMPVNLSMDVISMLKQRFDVMECNPRSTVEGWRKLVIDKLETLSPINWYSVEVNYIQRPNVNARSDHGSK
jgi:tRNA threonylcarbamoyladenosine biosynthesis protein TsaB